MSLKVEPFAGGVGRDENAQGVPGGRSIEGALERLALIGRRGAVVNLDALFPAVRPVNGGFQLVSKIASGVLVFGKDYEAQIGPGSGGGSWRGLTGRMDTGAGVNPQPVK